MALAALAVLCLAIALPPVFYYQPRQQALSISAHYVGTYYGLGWHREPGFMGKNWTHVRVDEGNGTWWEVDMDGYGYSPSRGYYANGVLMEESVCMVNENAISRDPAPDRHQVLHGKYYDPDGNLVSEVKEGTGRQVLHYADGVRLWELELRDGRRVEHISLWPSGHVIDRKATKNTWSLPSR